MWRIIEPSITLSQYSTTNCSAMWMIWSERSSGWSLWSAKTRRRVRCSRLITSFFLWGKEKSFTSYASNSLCKGTGSGSEKSKASGSGTTLADVEELIAEKNQALQKQHQLMQKQEKVILLFLKNIWVRGHSQMMSDQWGGGGCPNSD